MARTRDLFGENASDLGASAFEDFSLLDAFHDRLAGSSFQQQPLMESAPDQPTDQGPKNKGDALKTDKIVQAQKMSAPTQKLDADKATGSGPQSPKEIKQEANAKMDVAGKAATQVRDLKEAVKQAQEPGQPSAEPGNPSQLGSFVAGSAAAAGASHLVSPEAGIAVAGITTLKQGIDVAKSMLADNASGKGSLVTRGQGPSTPSSKGPRSGESKKMRESDLRREEGYSTSPNAPESRANVMDNQLAQMSKGPGFGKAPKLQIEDTTYPSQTLPEIDGKGLEDPKAYDQWIAQFENQKQDGMLAGVAQKVREQNGVAVDPKSAEVAMRLNQNVPDKPSFDGAVI
jgi:hypothetical protein